VVWEDIGWRGLLWLLARRRVTRDIIILYVTLLIEEIRCSVSNTLDSAKDSIIGEHPYYRFHIQQVLLGRVMTIGEHLGFFRLHLYTLRSHSGRISRLNNKPPPLTFWHLQDLGLSITRDWVAPCAPNTTRCV